MITNYNIIEKNSEDFEKIIFKFIVLDEGHMIKNVKTKKFKSVKRLKSSHRFILTGTPIQNRLK
jgi:TATA-binding protein-associated factor